MIESYALMFMVMGTFFVYFCGMVWAFCNPKLSGIEEETETELEAAPEDNCWICAHTIPPEQMNYRPGALPGTQQKTGDWIAQTTYINFLEDNDSLFTDRAGFVDSTSWRTLD